MSCPFSCWYCAWFSKVMTLCFLEGCTLTSLLRRDDSLGWLDRFPWGSALSRLCGEGYTMTGSLDYWCQECSITDLVCQACCVKHHQVHPLHCIEVCIFCIFLTPSSLTISRNGRVQDLSTSLWSQLASKSSSTMQPFLWKSYSMSLCPSCSPHKWHSWSGPVVLQLHTHNIQLLCCRFYPSSQKNVQMCATFGLLKLLHKLALISQSSTYDFYHTLEKLTNNMGVLVPKSWYCSLFHMVMQWHHLWLLKWGGHGHDPTGVTATCPGELAILCLSCPWPRVNLPEDWVQASPETRYVADLHTSPATLLMI